MSGDMDSVEQIAHAIEHLRIEQTNQAADNAEQEEAEQALWVSEAEFATLAEDGSPSGPGAVDAESDYRSDECRKQRLGLEVALVEDLR